VEPDFKSTIPWAVFMTIELAFQISLLERVEEETQEVIYIYEAYFKPPYRDPSVYCSGDVGPPPYRVRYCLHLLCIHDIIFHDGDDHETDF